MTNPLQEIKILGQSVWLDYIQRDILENGEVARMIEKDGLAGMTSNPSIFEKAIDEHDDYDEAISELARSGISAKEIYEVLTIEDVQHAAVPLDRRGVVSVMVGRAGGSTVEVARLEEGSFFGEMSLMTGERRSATIRAVTDCEVLVVSRNDLRPILEESPALVEGIGSVLAGRAERLGDNLAAREQAASKRGAVEQKDALLRRIRRFFSV